MSDPKKIKNWFARALDIAAQHREARETLRDMKTEDPERQMDWARLMALATARDADLHDADKHDRVEKLLAKGTYASWYADIVGIGNSEQIDHSRSSTKTEGRSNAGPAHSAPLAATVGDDRGNDPVADTNSDALAVQPSPLRNDSSAAAGMPSVPAAPIRESDEFNRIPEFLMR